VDVLEAGDVIEVLQEARQAGKTRYIGYSGDNEAALWAINSGIFDTLQTSFNLTEQRARTRLFSQAREKGIGIIVKRPIANGAWGVDSSPSGYADEYFRRAQIMQAMGELDGAPADRIRLALGFTLAHDEVDTAIVGTHNPAHMAANLAMVNEGVDLPREVIDELHARFESCDDDWRQRG
jgi:aryl-alcohol dehydrogenase-like predicted oxidoreductase